MLTIAESINHESTRKEHEETDGVRAVSCYFVVQSFRVANIRFCAALPARYRRRFWLSCFSVSSVV